MSSKRFTEFSTIHHSIHINEISETCSDEVLKYELYSYLMDEPITRNDIMIEVDNGNVVIMGVVNNETEKYALLTRLVNIYEIKSLNSTFMIFKSSDKTDEELRNELYNRLHYHHDLSQDSFRIEVTDGEVMIGGIMTKEEKIDTYAIIINTPGVKNVFDNIIIRE